MRSLWHDGRRPRASLRRVDMKHTTCHLHSKPNRTFLSIERHNIMPNQHRNEIHDEVAAKGPAGTYGFPPVIEPPEGSLAGTRWPVAVEVPELDKGTQAAPYGAATDFRTATDAEFLAEMARRGLPTRRH
jgi:hypothetical protein